MHIVIQHRHKAQPHVVCVLCVYVCICVCVSLASLNGEGVCFLSIERRQTPSLLREESVSLYIERKRDSFVI